MDKPVIRTPDGLFNGRFEHCPSQGRWPSHFIRCTICGAKGMSVDGYGWMRKCLKPHTFVCTCGRRFPGALPLGAHCAGHRRWKKSILEHKPVSL